MSIVKKIVSNTVSQIAAKVINAVMSIFIVKIITTTLGTYGYGEYAFVYEFLAFFLIAADLGLFTIGVSEMSEQESKIKKILGNIVGMRLFLCLLLCIFAVGLVSNIGNYSANIKLGVLIAAISMSINLISITLSAGLQTKLAMTWSALAITLGKVVMLGYVIFASQKYVGVGHTAAELFYHYLIAGLIGNILMLLVTYVATTRYIPVRVYFDWSYWLKLFKKTFYYGFSLVFMTIFLRVGTIVLQQFYTSSEVGLYQAPFRVYELMVLMPLILLNSILPILKKALTEDNISRAKKIMQYSFDTLSTLALPMLGGVYLLARPIIILLFDDRFLHSADILILLAVSALCVFFHTLFSYTLLALKKEKLLFKITLVIAVLAVFYNVLLVKMFSFYGAAGALIISQLLLLIVESWYVKKFIKYAFTFSIAIRATLATAMMMFVIRGMQTYNMNVVLILMSAIAVYFLALYFFGGMPVELLEELGIQNKKTKQIKKIAIDVRATIGQKAGKGWYVYNLMSALGEIDHTNKYYLYARHNFNIPASLGGNFKKVIIPLPLFVWHIGVLVDILLRRIDVLFAPSSYIIPSICFFRKPRVVVVIHDLVAFLFPRHHELKARTIEKSTVNSALANASHIICVSENTKKDVQKLFNIVNKKLTVVAEAARENFLLPVTRQKMKRIKKKYKLPNKFILFVGTLEPRKNLAVLVKAYGRLPNKLRQQYKLVIVGKKGWYYKEIFETVQQQKLNNDVYFTGYLPDEDLPAILHASTLFVYPSKYEGFGLPLLEAFACECPVVCSDTPALIEVASGVAEIVTNDLQIISEGLKKILTNPLLQDKMKKRGRQRVAQYSWQDTAQQVLRIISD